MSLETNARARKGPIWMVVLPRPREHRLLASIFDPANGLAVFSAGLLIVYALVPGVVFAFALPNDAFLRLAVMTMLTVVAMWVGSLLPLCDKRMGPQAPRIAVGQSFFIAATWSVFAVFLLVTFATAPSVPILSALQGAAASALSEERGAFLKGREGPELALLYLSTFLVNTIVPYSIVLLYASGSRLRHILASVFFLFCVSFLQKTLFLNLVLPLLAYLSAKGRLRGAKAIGLLSGSLLVVVGAIYLSQVAGSTFGASWGLSDPDYFSAAHWPESPAAFLVWRAIAVPVFTATDTLLVHSEQFGGAPLLGATSSLVSIIFGLQRVNLERIVFEHQFGGWNEIGNANAVFVVDAYVNFGWIGLLLFGVVVGQIFRMFKRSKDVGFRSLWPVFAFVLFSAPLVGMLLSNGFLFMLVFALFVRLRQRGRHHA